MPIQDLPIFCYYDKQRFTQFGSQDCANWYGIAVDSGKKKQALYPAMGRKHVRTFNQNQLIFNAEPRAVFRTINYIYVIDGTQVQQFDRFFNRKIIGSISLGTQIWFAFLTIPNGKVRAIMTDETNLYLIEEDGTTVTYAQVTDTARPLSPVFVANFGNRIVVSTKNSPQFQLSTINLDGGVSGCFTFSTGPIIGQASGNIGQLAVLHTQLYIMCDFVTDVWANIQSNFTVGNVTSTFPWKQNTSFNFDYGISDPNSLSIDFGRMTWLAKNANGLVSFMTSTGQQPEDISSQAINVLLENSMLQDGLSPFLTSEADGFLYQYENTVFYRVSAGPYTGTSVLDQNTLAHSIEYNYETKTWGRCIELNGERNRIKKHIYFNNSHLVTVLGDPAMYDMAGNIYYNETINSAQLNHQASDAFLKFPMRYELTTQQLYQPDYSENIDDYVEIDFVFGNMTFYRDNAPFLNTIFVVDESSTPEIPVYLITEDGSYIVDDGSNTPTFDDNHYNDLFKPYIELYFSDDGAETFTPADVREFSPLGQYRWRMRWYELGPNRNRCYRLVCVSSSPIVILGAVRNTRRASGGAN